MAQDSPTGQLRIRCAALARARLPIIDRYVAAAPVGKSTAIITNVHTTGRQPASPSTF